MSNIEKTIKNNLKLSIIDNKISQVSSQIPPQIPSVNIDLQECVILLKWLGTLNEGEKLDISTLQIYKNTFKNAVYRTFWTDESRDKSLQFIYFIIDNALSLIDKLYLEYKTNKAKKQSIENLINAICLSCNGLRNFKMTYKSDRMLMCCVDNIIENRILVKFYELSHTSPELTKCIDFNKLKNVEERKETKEDKKETKKENKKEDDIVEEIDI
jgi:hypothetical protein